jgi:hypothetical protein
MLRKSDQIAFRASDLAGPLAARAGEALSAPRVAKRDLARYYALLDRELTRLRLSREDAVALVAVTRGWESSAETDPRGLLHELADADPDEVAVPADLIPRLTAAGQASLLAVLDACERYWREPSRADDPIGALARVGLTREG